MHETQQGLDVGRRLFRETSALWSAHLIRGSKGLLGLGGSRAAKEGSPASSARVPAVTLPAPALLPPPADGLSTCSCGPVTGGKAPPGPPARRPPGCSPDRLTAAKPGPRGCNAGWLRLSRGGLGQLRCHSAEGCTSSRGAPSPGRHIRQTVRRHPKCIQLAADLEAPSS